MSTLFLFSRFLDQSSSLRSRDFRYYLDARLARGGARWRAFLSQGGEVQSKPSIYRGAGGSRFSVVEPGPSGGATSGCGAQTRSSLLMDLNKMWATTKTLEFEEWEPSEGSFISHMVRW